MDYIPGSLCITILSNEEHRHLIGFSVVFSPHSFARCKNKCKGDAGGDIWTSASHFTHQRLGRSDQVY